jgi:class 3 adenylate cyclase/tetratricopeptide (TPR) repeat protein
MVMFCDLVGSTELSGRHDPERYADLVRRYVGEARQTIEDRYGGHVVNVEGDGILALFGAPHAHGDDAERAIRAAIDIVDRVRTLSIETEREVGESLAVRIAVHRGHIYWAKDNSVYGLATNVAARLQALAAPNEIVISDDVQRMVDHLFETVAGGPQTVKGVEQPLWVHRVVGERAQRMPRRDTRSPLINRQQEWGRLRTAWSDVVEGEADGAVAVLVRGDAGVGKSYLASRVAALASDDGATVVELGGFALFEDVGLYPVRRLIERMAGIEPNTDGVQRLRFLRRDLDHRGLGAETYVPRLAPILGIKPEVGYVAEPVDARKLNEEIVDAACTYVEACLGDAPGVLVVEDLHWCDSSTRDVVTRLARRREPCVVVMTARPGVAPWARVEVIELEPFSEQDSGRLVDALCSDKHLSAAVRENVVARGDGIPLYIEELVANVQQGAASLPDDTSAPSSGSVPDLLYDLLAARLRFAADAIPVASASAVIGRDVDRHVLETLLELSRAELDTALVALCDQGVLEHRSGGDGQYRFRHELLREVAYELQPPSRRRHIHGKLADVLTSPRVGSNVVDWGVAASHFEAAGRMVEASDALREAAAAARLRGAFAEARGYLTRAIELLTSNVEQNVERDVREVRLRLHRGYLAASEEGPASRSAAADYERCLDLAAADPSGDEMFETVIVLWTYHLTRGELVQARRISELTFRSLDRREWYRSFNIAAYGILDCWEGDLRAARDLLEMFNATRVQADEERFLSQWLMPGDPVTVILSCVGVVRFMMGEIGRADEAFRDALERTETLSFPQGPYSAAYALSVEAWMRLEREQFDEAEDRIAHLSDIASRHGFDGWTMVAVTLQTVLRALQALHGGAGADDLARHALSVGGMIEVWQRFDTRFFLPYYLTTVGVLQVAAGDTDSARASFGAALSLADETEMRFWQAETIRHAAHLEPDADSRRRKLEAALAVARTQPAPLFELRVALDLERLVPGRARAAVDAALGRLGRGSAYPEVARAHTVLAGP